jgi:hypothetical protein
VLDDNGILLIDYETGLPVEYDDVVAASPGLSEFGYDPTPEPQFLTAYDEWLVNVRQVHSF